jgi:hypothetical protein
MPKFQKPKLLQRFLLKLVFFFLLTKHSIMNAQSHYSSEEMKKTYEKDTIILAQKSYEKNGVKTSFYPVFPKGFLRQEIAKNGGKEANIEYKHLKNVRNFWILNGLQLVIAILSSLVIGSNRLLLGISFLATFILIISSIIVLQRLKRRLAYAILHYNKNVMSNKPS